MPTRTPASQPPPPAQPPQLAVSRHVAFVRPITRSGRAGEDYWLSGCYQVTLHLQRLGHDAALLDLGPCTDDEALAVMRALLDRLRAWRITMRAAIGPSGILAQLAFLHAPIREQLAVVTPEHSMHLLQSLPVAALTRLQLPGALSLSPKVIARLEGYGIRTLGQLAHLDEVQLCRQFGGHVGKLLATVVRGDDPLPLQPTPAPQRLHFRGRYTTPVTADRFLVDLMPFAREVANVLARRGAQASSLDLRLRWENGMSDRVTRTLVQPIAEARTLAETLVRLLTPVLQAASTMSAASAQRLVEDLRLIVSDLTPRYPAQHSFWPERAQRVAAMSELAERLARRHGKPLVYHGVSTAPDAIFDQNRSRWVPVSPSAADVLENHEQSMAWPASGACTASDAAEAIPHEIHWW